MSERDDPDAMQDAWEDRQRRARANAGCACFRPGEASGTCPGRDRCPMCEPLDDDDEGDDE